MKITYREAYDANTFISHENFFSEEMLKDIQQRVIALRPYWHTGKAPFMNYLPAGVYLRNRAPEYDATLEEYRRLMLSNFDSHYKQLKKYISTILEIPCEYHPPLMYPGFHIFGPGEDGAVDRISIREFHQDNDYPFPPGVVEGEIFSFVVPIILPRVGGAGLVYHKDGKEYEIPYKVNRIVSWSGELPHTFGPFQLSGSSDYRITFQSHVNVIDNKGIIFW